MNIFIVRHGRTIWNTTRRWQGSKDIPLDEVGLEQAHKLAEKLMTYPIHKIYSSPLQRTAATAQAVGEKLNLPIIYRDDLKEICLGEWEGNTFTEINEKYANAFMEWETNPHAQVGFGVENNYDLQQRAWLAFDSICRLEDEDTLIVSHGAWINRLMCKLLHIPMEHRSNFELLNTGISIIKCKKEVETHKHTIITLNDVSHLS